MLSRLLPVLFCCLNVVILHAQQDSNTVKTLLQAAAAIPEDAERSDSVELLATRARDLSISIGYKPGQQQASDLLASYYFQKGKLSRSLEMLQGIEEYAISIKDSLLLFNTLRMEGSVYNRINDLNMFRSSVWRRQAILNGNGIPGLADTSYAVLSQYNTLAQYYAVKQVDLPDSVAFYYRKMNQAGKGTAMENLWVQLSNGGLGNMYLKKGTYDSAIHYLRIASEAALAGRRMDNHYGYTTSLARAYDFMGQTDSAFRIIRYVNNGATRYDYISVMVTAAGLLARLHNQQHRYDSAVIYLMQERALKDSITGLETLNSIQYLTSDYQQKTLEREREKQEAVSNYKAKLKNYYFAGGILLLLLVIGVLYRINNQRSRSKKAIETAYEELKTTQAQLVHSEKMASLGELTAGIAHEIQNPLNFVNNFSEVSNELADEMNMELDKGDIAEAKLLANDIRQNLEKITFHGKRADAIVKGMLQHSRNSSGQPEPTDLNKLADEYLRLAYHGLRAKDKTFNSAVETDFDPAVGSVRIIPQDIGRVVMNLLTNAFYAVNEKTRSGVAGQEDYKPTVSISTIRETGRVRIIITDNGNGIPPEIREKIFQPFFTTKPTGEGTGLGLSMSFDIITKGHAGRLTMDSNLGSGTSFTIELPIR